jgi:hypothetical protein
MPTVAQALLVDDETFGRSIQRAVRSDLGGFVVLHADWRDGTLRGKLRCCRRLLRCIRGLLLPDLG